VFLREINYLLRILNPERKCHVFIDLFNLINVFKRGGSGQIFLIATKERATRKWDLQRDLKRKLERSGKGNDRQ